MQDNLFLRVSAHPTREDNICMLQIPSFKYGYLVDVCKHAFSIADPAQCSTPNYEILQASMLLAC